LVVCDSLSSFAYVFIISRTESVIHNNAPQHPTTSQHHNITANKMSDWSFVNKFAEGIAKRAGVTTDSVWEAMLSGRPPIGSEEGGPKDKFTEEEMHGF
jgi:hypothetical protein